MAYEKIVRNRYHEPGSSEDPEHTSANHSDDFQDFHIPLERMHNSNLHGWGIASGLEVSGTIGGTDIIVNPGVAIDSNGQLISLSNEGKGNIGNPPEDNNEARAPVELSTVNYAGKQVYVTIQFSEVLRAGGVAGKLEQVPWVRLQPVNTLSTLDEKLIVDGKTIVLAIAEINSEGKIDELKAAGSVYRRCIIGQSIEELRIQRSSKIEDEVQKVKDMLSGKIGPGAAGGLKITVPDTQDNILFAREDGSNFSNFANLEIRANVGIGTSSPSEKLEVNGTIKAGKFIGDGSGLTKAGQWTDVEGGISYNVGNAGIGTTDPKEKLDVFGTIRLFGKNAFQGYDSFLRINQDNEFPSGTHFLHRANFHGGITTGTWWDVDPGVGNLLVRGNVGIGTTSTESTLSIGSSNFKLDKGEESPNAGYILFGDNTGWKFHIGRSQESVGGSFNKGTTGILMTIQDNGNVGIGTTSPSAKLDVKKGGIKWGNSYLSEDQGGSIELGGSSQTPGQGTSYIDFHYKGLLEDYNTRIINDYNGRLAIISPTLYITGNVSIGGKLSSREKNFLIDHPLYPDTHELVHSTLEGPEVAVFYRGEAKLSNNEATVKLPDYFETLTRKENRTVLLTPKFEGDNEISMLAASEVKDGKFTVKTVDSKNLSQKFYWEVKAVRADVELLEVQKEKIPVE